MNRFCILFLIGALVVLRLFVPSPVSAQTALTLGVSVSGSLSNPGDEEYYEVTVSAGQHLFVLLDGADNLDAYSLYIRFGVLPTPTEYDDMGDSPNADQAVEVASTQAGTYFILVRSNSGGGNFSIVAHNSSTFPTVTMAIPMPGTLDDTYDINYYQVSVPAGNHLFAILDSADNLDHYDLYIKYGSLPSITDYADMGDLPNADQGVEIPVSQAGTYYLMIRSTSSGGAYRVTVDDGNTFPTLDIGIPKIGNLVNTYDLDFYQVITAAGEHLSVLLDGMDNLDHYDLYIKYGSLPSTVDYDAMGSLPNADQGVEIPVTQAGAYFILVRSTSSGGSYSLVAHTSSTFPSLTIGTTRTGNLQDTYDVEFYQVTVPAGQHLFVLLDGADNLDHYDLYIKYGGLPSTTDYADMGDLPNADQAVEIASTQAGIYYVLVRSTSSGGSFTITAHDSTTFPTLTIGTPRTASLQDSYDVKFYQVAASAGIHLFTLLDGADNLDHYDLYIKDGLLPSTTDYADMGDLPNADQAVEAANTLAGMYYVMIRSTSSGGNFIITAHNSATFPTLAIGTPTTASLQDTYDVKFYQVAVPAGQHLFALLDGADNLDHYDLYIKDGLLPSTTDYADMGDLPNADQAVEATNTLAGMYYVMIRSTSSGGNFTITAHDSATFPTLAIGTPTTASLQDTYDVKFFQVTVPAGQHLFALLDGADNLDHYDLYVKYAGLPSTTDYADMGDLPNADQAVEIATTQAGTYYVMLRSVSSGGNITITAHNSATFPTLTTGTSTNAGLQGTYDVKFYQVTPAAMEHLFVLLDGADNLNHYDLYIRHSALPTTIDYLANGSLPNADQAVEIPGAAAGSYYVMIRSTSSGGNYSITAHNSATFPTLGLATPVTGSLQGTYDVKFYQVTPLAGRAMLIILDGADLYDQYDLYVRFGALPTLGTYDFLSDRSGADQAVRVDPTQPGTYYILIRATSGGGSYNLRVAFWTVYLPLTLR